uniref:Uncharacterized protein n=1 Tax=Scleropages formosus TaxID=113540 RepID=A0A8C9VR95_SCLFO
MWEAGLKTEKAEQAPPTTVTMEDQQVKCSAFERVLHAMAHDERVVGDLVLGRRVAFYELRGEIGSGNFSHVKLGIHTLTKGESSCSEFERQETGVDTFHGSAFSAGQERSVQGAVVCVTVVNPPETFQGVALPILQVSVWVGAVVW